MAGQFPLFLTVDPMTVRLESDNRVRFEEKETEQTAFFPGSIRSEEVREFWQTNIKAEEWVIMDTLKKGETFKNRKQRNLIEKVRQVNVRSTWASSLAPAA